MKLRAPKTRTPLAMLGVHWATTVRAPQPHPRLVRDAAGRYRCAEIPEGLPHADALGLTLAIRWAELDQQHEDMQTRIRDETCPADERAQLQDALAGRRPLVTRAGEAWLVALPGEEPLVLPTDAAVVITRALLEVRRRVRPCPRPFAPRDPQAETLQLHLRAMEAELRGPIPVITVHPPLIESDLGRNWSGGYTCSG